ncbi:MAG TPA: hypothetical protein VKX25_19545 [Bryobacteraceae bacterium]|jgi:hypothetical protein|nr:hypothetical protein [Bryobacteraceae bacterium]
MPFDEAYPCDDCRCRTFASEVVGDCQAPNCWRTWLCEDCGFECQYCHEIFCEQHSTVISGDDESKLRYACDRCIARRFDSELLLHLQNIAIHALSSGWDVISLRNQKGILHLIAETKNQVLLGGRKAA